MHAKKKAPALHDRPSAILHFVCGCIPGSGWCVYCMCCCCRFYGSGLPLSTLRDSTTKYHRDGTSGSGREHFDKHSIVTLENTEELLGCLHCKQGRIFSLSLDPGTRHRLLSTSAAGKNTDLDSISSFGVDGECSFIR